LADEMNKRGDLYACGVVDHDGRVWVRSNATSSTEC
jgi:hypothetical protein